MTPDEGAASCGICRAIERIRSGGLRDLVAELPNCYVVLGDAQFYRGYCILFAKRHATELYLMPTEEARELCDEMRLMAKAIATVVKPWKMNYECLGNTEPHVHWHLFPRFQSESDDLRRGPIWKRPDAERMVALPDQDRRALIGALREQIRTSFPDARIPED